MATEIRVPTLGESVTEATIGKWFKKVGDAIAADEPLVELETDKVTVEVPAPAAGTLSEISAKEGETVGLGALLGTIGGTARASPRRSGRSRSSRRQQAARGSATMSRKRPRRPPALPASRRSQERTSDAASASCCKNARRSDNFAASRLPVPASAGRC